MSGVLGSSVRAHRDEAFATDWERLASGGRFPSINIVNQVEVKPIEESVLVDRSRPEDLTFLDSAAELSIGFMNYIGTSDQAIVELDVSFMNNDSREEWIVTGSSRRDRSDKGNEDVGLLLATSRALSTVARHFEKQAEGKMKHAEDVRVAAKKKRDAKAKETAATKRQTKRQIAARQKRADKFLANLDKKWADVDARNV